MSGRIDQEFYKRHGMGDLKDDNGTSKTLSAAARRSFFRRRLKHKRSGSKDGKDLMALEALSSDSLPITEGGASYKKELKLTKWQHSVKKMINEVGDK